MLLKLYLASALIDWHHLREVLGPARVPCQSRGLAAGNACQCSRSRTSLARIGELPSLSLNFSAFVPFSDAFVCGGTNEEVGSLGCGPSSQAVAGPTDCSGCFLTTTSPHSSVKPTTLAQRDRSILGPHLFVRTVVARPTWSPVSTDSSVHGEPRRSTL